jgi:hypothetical protein
MGSLPYRDRDRWHPESQSTVDTWFRVMKTKLVVNGCDRIILPCPLVLLLRLSRSKSEKVHRLQSGTGRLQKLAGSGL